MISQNTPKVFHVSALDLSSRLHLVRLCARAFLKSADRVLVVLLEIFPSCHGDPTSNSFLLHAKCNILKVRGVKWRSNDPSVINEDAAVLLRGRCRGF